MIKSFFLSLGCFGNKTIRAVFFKSLALTLLFFIIVGGGLYYSSLSIPTLWGMDITTWAPWVTGLVTSMLILFTFRIVAILILWVFADDIVDAIEWEYYSHEAVSAAKPSNIESLLVGLRALLRAIIYNILAIPLYILALLTFIGAPMVFTVINGILLGRELEEMVALRHKNHIRLQGQENPYELGKIRRLLLGLLMNMALLIPFVNLVIPVIAASMATHMMHRKGSL